MFFLLFGGGGVKNRDNNFKFLQIAHTRLPYLPIKTFKGNVQGKYNYIVAVGSHNVWKTWVLSNIAKWQLFEIQNIFSGYLYQFKVIIC